MFMIEAGTMKMDGFWGMKEAVKGMKLRQQVIFQEEVPIKEFEEMRI